MTNLENAFNELIWLLFSDTTVYYIRITIYYLITGEETFGQRPPPLIECIKGILNNYPDGSQILKVSCTIKVQPCLLYL